MRISVTAKDIAVGIQKSICGCPIALAFNRSLGDSWDVAYYQAENSDGDLIELPPECVEFQTAFDAGHMVEPFEFEIEIEERRAGA